MELFNFFINRFSQISVAAEKHFQLTVIAVLVSIIVGVILGTIITKFKILAPGVIGFANLLQAVPSLALLGFLVPVMGIGENPAILMVFLYSLLPIIKNTYTGLNEVNDEMKEAGRAMGMTSWQLLYMVEFPIAIPVIMSGIRISAVTAVGLMTIAAYVGAGGLGELIFTGIQTINNNMILSGAIPACLFALLLDFIIGKIEKKMSSKINKDFNKKFNIGFLGKFNIKKIIAGIIVIILVMVGLQYKSKQETIVIGAKNFTENQILSNIYSEIIQRDTHYKVETNLSLGGTEIAFTALENNSIDMYVEYTGTGLVSILKEPGENDADKVYNKVKDEFETKYGLYWLNPIGFNNTYALAVREDIANKYSLNTISDLAKVSSNLIIGTTMEFSERSDGLNGLKEKYNLKFKDQKKMDSGVRYSAINSNEIQVVDAFTTDAMVKALNLKILIDDKNYFPPYYAAPLVSKKILNKYPDLKLEFDKLKGKITNDKMMELNYEVDKLGKDPKDVAHDFLEKNIYNKE